MDLLLAHLNAAVMGVCAFDCSVMVVVFEAFLFGDNRFCFKKYLNPKKTIVIAISPKSRFFNVDVFILKNLLFSDKSKYKVHQKRND